MENPNVVLDDDDPYEDEEPGEALRLKTYLNWKVSV